MSLALFLCVSSFVLAQPADYVPEPVPCESALTVGCYYFPGHFSPARWIPMRDAEYPMPLLGYYRDGTPEVADWHIKWAVEHGIDFFAFDWYGSHVSGPNDEHNKALDEGFLRARYRDRMQFCLMWCNEGGEEHYTREEMQRLTATLIERYFSQPNHLRVNGDNLLIISVPGHFTNSFGVDGTRAVFAELDAQCRAAGCGGFYPVAKGHADQQQLKDAGFRAITAYNYPHAGMDPSANRAPYADMVTGMEAIWRDVTAVNVLPYIVPVSPGWDSRPWHGEHALARTNPRPRLYYEMCVAAKQYVNPELNMVIAECWNEFGEGSYVEPTVQYGFGYLDAMRDAFCEDNPHHMDAVPASVGQDVPRFERIPLRPEDALASGENLLFNGDIETDWGWVTFAGKNARVTEGTYAGEAALLVPAGQGVKTQWLMPVPDGPVRITFQYRGEGTLTVQAALFRRGQWLGRYAPIGTAEASAEWQLFEATVAIDDPDAEYFNVEFAARGEEEHPPSREARDTPFEGGPKDAKPSVPEMRQGEGFFIDDIHVRIAE